MIEGGMFRQLQAESRDLGPMSPIPAALYDSTLGEEEAASLIRKWVLENYEDTIRRYGPRGYRADWGPYDIQDIVTIFFLSLVGRSKVDRALTELRLIGSESLVPHIDRLRRAGVAQENRLHEEMLRRIAELEEKLRLIEQAPAGQGHNHPPEPIGDPPLTAGDRQEIAAALDVLKAQPVNPSDIGVSAKEATAVVNSKGQKLVAWLAGIGFVADVTSLWQAYGQTILEAITNLVNAATAWIASLPLS